MKDVTKFILDNWVLLAPLVYEILARLWPTKWNVSILDNLWTIINKIIPNLRKAQPTDEMVSATKNKVVVDTKKHILKTLLVLFLFSITLTSQAQTWQAYKGLWLKNYDTLSSVPAIPSGYGAFVATDFGLYAYDTAWFNLRQDTTSGGGFTNSAGAFEIIGSDGTNGITSHMIFSTTGDLTLGLNTDGGDPRRIAMNGSAADIGFEIAAKSSIGQFVFSASPIDDSFEYFYASGATLEFFGADQDSIRLQPSNGTSITLNGGGENSTTVSAKNVVLNGGQNQDTGRGGNVVITGGQSQGGINGDVILRANNAIGTPGNIILLGLPTSSAGLPSGALWLNVGVLSIVP